MNNKLAWTFSFLFFISLTPCVSEVKFVPKLPKGEKIDYETFYRDKFMSIGFESQYKGMNEDKKKLLHELQQTIFPISSNNQGELKIPVPLDKIALMDPNLRKRIISKLEDFKKDPSLYWSGDGIRRLMGDDIQGTLPINLVTLFPDRLRVYTANGVVVADKKGSGVEFAVFFQEDGTVYPMGEGYVQYQSVTPSTGPALFATLESDAIIFQSSANRCAENNSLAAAFLKNSGRKAFGPVQVVSCAENSVHLVMTIEKRGSYKNPCTVFWDGNHKFLDFNSMNGIEHFMSNEVYYWTLSDGSQLFYLSSTGGSGMTQLWCLDKKLWQIYPVKGLLSWSDL